MAEGLRADKPEGRGKSSIERQVPVDSEDDISRVASLLHAQRHVDPSITTLAAQDATVGCAADRLLRRGNFLMVQALTACATASRRSYPLAKPS